MGSQGGRLIHPSELRVKSQPTIFGEAPQSTQIHPTYSTKDAKMLAGASRECWESSKKQEICGTFFRRPGPLTLPWPQPRHRLQIPHHCRLPACLQEFKIPRAPGDTEINNVNFTFTAHRILHLIINITLGAPTNNNLTLKGQCKHHRIGIILGESCPKLLLHCTEWGFQNAKSSTLQRSILLQNRAKVN